MAAALVVPTISSAAEDTIKIGLIDPLSGPFANVGDLGVKTFGYLAERINANGGVLGRDIEIVPFDNKGSAQESLQNLKEAADEGIHYITQGLGSHVGGALIDGVEKHNRRNPDNRVVYLNFAAVDPAFTNEKCSFWHFRFDANSAMKMKVITDVMADEKEIKKVFLINQDYSHGQYISKAGKEMLAEKRPDIEIVGDVLHPLGKVKDFAPYISEIKSSGADAVISGNWGNDLALLVKAGSQAGLDVDYYTYYAALVGAPRALGKAAAGKVKIVTEFQENLAVDRDSAELTEIVETFSERYSPFDFTVLRIKTELDMLVAAMEKAGSSDPLKVAYAMEDLSVPTAMGDAMMRAQDHQLLQPLYISTLSKEYAKYDAEDTGLGWVMDTEIPADETAVASSCEMDRPERSGS
jgi:branched-chain amino acid transport system substrate-binding protein